MHIGKMQLAKDFLHKLGRLQKNADGIRWFAFPISHKGMEMFPLSSLNPDRAPKKNNRKSGKESPMKWKRRDRCDLQ